MRQISGSGASIALEVAARHDGRSEQLQLVLRNESDSAVQFTATDAYGKPDAKQYTLRPHASTTETIGLQSTSGWYDLSVVSASDSTFLRRLAGHVETGRPSTSDPAIGSH